LPSSSEQALRIVATATAAIVDTTRMPRNLIDSGIPGGTDVHARVVQWVPGHLYTFTVEATGTISASVGDPRTEVGPDGSPNPEFTGANRDEHGVQVGGGHGALIGTLSRDFPPFLIGASNTIEFERDGHLFLSVNDGGLDNNAGEFNVTLTIRRAGGS